MFVRRGSPSTATVTPALVLIHGLGRTPRAMWPLAAAARRRGYRVLNLGYRSRSTGIAGHAAYLASRVERFAPDGPLYFATHSLGGIVLRYAVARGMLPAERISRVVMLAPPNSGSEVAEFVTEHRWLRPVSRRVLGPCGPELGIGPRSVVRQLPPVEFELGVIAGSRALFPLFRNLLPEVNDGTVTVRGTSVDGMRDHIVVPSGHSLIMASPRVIAQTFTFLELGHFAR